MIELSRDSNIYISATANYYTGGTLLLHQLASELDNMGFLVRMYYSPHEEDPVHENFKKLKIKWTKAIVDEPSNVLVIPEVSTQIIRTVSKVRVVVWWLSVDNFYKSLNSGGQIKVNIKRALGYRELYKKADFHLAQSHYAIEYLLEKGINATHLSDYLDETFLNFDQAKVGLESRTDVVLYNPKKGLDITEALMKMAPNLQWMPLINMTPNEVKSQLLKSKVYVDFGEHPGKDRFPREAALSGCCIITGMKGSAKNDIDVPIPQMYKFDTDSDHSTVAIIKMIIHTLANYEQVRSDFDNYRSIILSEKVQFKKEVRELFYLM